MEFLKFDKNRIVAFIISLFVLAILSFLYIESNIFDGLERGAVDRRFKLREPFTDIQKITDKNFKASIIKPNENARKDIIIIGIDESTIRYFAQKGIKWQFTWDVHAKLTRNLSYGDPYAIFFDIMFIDPPKKTEKRFEKELAEAIKYAKNVFLDFPFEKNESDKNYADIDERMEIFNKLKIPKNKQDNEKEWLHEVLPPLPILSKAAKNIGFANIDPDEDNVNRKMPIVVKYQGYYYPNIDLLIVMHYFGITLKDIEIKMGEYVKLKNLPVNKMAKPNKERTITIPINSKGFMDINFAGGPGSFNYYPYYMMYIDKNVHKDSFKDKLLLIAAYSVTGLAKDVHKSPFGDLFGIEHHANALNTILNQDFIINLTENQNLIILIILTILLGFILPRISTIKSIIVAIFLLLLYSIGSIIVFDTFNLLYIFAIPLIQIIITFSLITTYKVLSEQQEKKYIRQTFSKFVSKSVVDELLKHPEKVSLGGEKKNLTVLFSDIRGFTSISEKVSPEKLIEHLNEYLQAMTDIIIKYDGTLDKYVGDEIMAFWGAPLPQEDHALLACKSALEMLNVLNMLNDNWIKLGKETLNIGIGINSGEMTVGNIGSSSRLDYTLIGDNVNLGARLEGTNKVYRTHIIISESTYSLVKNNVIVRELDLIRVKGKANTVKIFELIDLI